MAARLQRRRTRGWRMPVAAVYVGRPSPWGNPYRVGINGSAAECVDQFRQRYTDDAAYLARVRAALGGKSLVCWCPVGTPCHGEVLLGWAHGNAVLEASHA